MFRPVVVSFLIASYLCSTGCGSISAAGSAEKKFNIILETPPNAARVASPLLLKGRVDGSIHRGYLVVIVHPLATPLYFVQRSPSRPNADGVFQTLCYLGTKSGAGLNEEFEIVVLLSKRPLDEGTTFRSLPSSLASSDIITVTRVR